MNHLTKITEAVSPEWNGAGRIYGRNTRNRNFEDGLKLFSDNDL